MQVHLGDAQAQGLAMLDELAGGRSRIVTASARGWSGAADQRGTAAALAAVSVTWWMTWLIAVSLG